jgi:hypothetical protein
MESGGYTPLSISMPASRNGTPSLSTNVNGHGDATTTTMTTRQIKICVYCGSSPGNDPAHMEAARELARAMAANNIALGESHLCPT